MCIRDRYLSANTFELLLISVRRLEPEKLSLRLLLLRSGRVQAASTSSLQNYYNSNNFLSTRKVIYLFLSVCQLQKHLGRENLGNVILNLQVIFVLLALQYDRLNHIKRKKSRKNFFQDNSATLLDLLH